MNNGSDMCWNLIRFCVVNLNSVTDSVWPVLHQRCLWFSYCAGVTSSQMQMEVIAFSVKWGMGANLSKLILVGQGELGGEVCSMQLWGLCVGSPPHKVLEVKASYWANVSQGHTS